MPDCLSRNAVNRREELEIEVPIDLDDKLFGLFGKDLE
jgi:hypothetical protein